MILWEAITQRRSIRSFENRAIPESTLKEVLAAGMYAPSPLNSQPWRFYVADGHMRDTLISILREYPVYTKDFLADAVGDHIDDFMEYVKAFAQDLGGAPVIVLVTVPKVEDEHTKLNNLYAAACAIQNIQLAAWEKGIGTVFLTSSLWLEDKVLDAAGISNEQLVTVLPMGYPRETPAAPPRDPAVVTWLRDVPAIAVR